MVVSCEQAPKGAVLAGRWIIDCEEKLDGRRGQERPGRPSGTGPPDARGRRSDKQDRADRLAHA
jgi:hypothetical protein